MAEKTEARKKAEYMEKYRLAPATTRNKAVSGVLRGPDMMRGPSEVYDYVRSKVSPRTPRTEEEMSELTREVGRAESARLRPGNVDPTLSPAAREALMNMRDADARRKMGQRYDEIMPSPEPGESKAKGGKISGYAKGGSVRGSGCEQRGLRKCKMVKMAYGGKAC